MNSTLSTPLSSRANMLGTKLESGLASAHPTLQQLFIPPFQMSVTVGSRPELWNCVQAFIDNPEPSESPKALITFLSLEVLKHAQQDRVYRNALNQYSLMNLPEGEWVHRLSKIAGVSLPKPLSLTGWLSEWMAFATEREYSIFILGNDPDTLARTKAALREQERLPLIAGCWARQEASLNDPRTSQHVIEMIQETRPEMLVIALSDPFSIHWIQNHWDMLPPCLILSVGKAFELYSRKKLPAFQQIRQGFQELVFARRMFNRVRVYRAIGKRGASCE